MSKMAPSRILHLEDSARDSQMIQDLLETSGFTHGFTRAADREQFDKALAEPRYDLIICDFNLPDFNGLSAIEMAREKHAETPVIIVSGAMDAEEAVACLRAGATDYLLKQRLERLPSAVARALEEGRGMRQRREARARLRESEERLSLALQVADLGMWDENLRTGIATWSERVFEQVGLPPTPDATVPSSIWDSLLHPDDLPLFRKKLEEARRTRSKCVSEHRIVWAKNGDIRWQAISAMFMFDHSGEAARLLGVSADITERKRAEETLRTSEARMSEQAKMLSSVRDAVFARDLDQRIFYWNSGAERLYGWTAQEAFGRRANDLLCADLNSSVLMDEILRTGEWRGELRHRNKDGRTIIVESFRSLLTDEAGRPSGVLSINTDITARKQAMAAFEQTTAELRQAKAALEKERAQLAQHVAERTADLSAANAELARANRLKSEFMANMSHELRTPLNAILGLSESLLEQRSAPLTERQARAVRTIESSGTHLLSLINDVLDVSKVEAGKVELQVEGVDTRAVCEASLQLVRQQAIGKRLEIQFTCEVDARPLQADARRLKQILVNLLSNAVKFTPEGGKIGLDVSGDAAANRVSFSVWDTGIGIAPEDQARLFQPFVQVQTHLSREYEGTGLGLVLVQRLAEIHGGGVSLDSEPGRGSRFTVHLPWSNDRLVSPRLPAARPQPAASSPSMSGPTAPGGPCILLVEDNETNIQTIGDYLFDHDFSVAVARNGKEAIEQVRSAQPALILMDIQMPVMNGLETIRHLRTDPSLASLPIIALTALAMPGDREHCLATGANGYLSKPVNLRELTEHIRQHLNLSGPA